MGQADIFHQDPSYGVFLWQWDWEGKKKFWFYGNRPLMSRNRSLGSNTILGTLWMCLATQHAKYGLALIFQVN
jgi:hypothetical protein